MKKPIYNLTNWFTRLAAIMLYIVASWSTANGQSRDITKVSEDEFNRDINESDEQRDKRRLKVSKRGAMDYYWGGNFRAAIEDFLILLSKDPSNVETNFYIGACYLESNIDKTKAISYLEYVVQQPKFPKEAIYQLGRAYMFAHRFDEAITTFNQFKEISRGKEDNIITGSRMIEMCFNGKQLLKYPRDVTFENLGGLVNSPYPDYNPFIPEDESFIVFCTKRPDCLGLYLDYDGYKATDIFRSRTVRGKFKEAHNIGSSVNTEYFEEVVGISADGQELLVYIDNFDGYDDIMVSPRKGRFFDEYKDFGKNINTDDIETTAGLSTDGNLVFFSRETGKGKKGTDLYMSRRLPNGRWGIGQRLPDVINTEYNESFPHLAANGRTLYFCSEGHTSMGGFDIFTTEWDELTNTWSVPRNVGYPINTVDDDFNISMSTTGRYGYISQFRTGGLGERDIYRVTFNEVIPVESIVRGSVTNIKDSLAMDPNFEIGDVVMTVTNDLTGEFIGTYRPHGKSSNYVQVLEPGSYCVYIESELFYDTAEVLTVMGKNAQVRELIKDYTLRNDPEKWRKRMLGEEQGGNVYAMSGSPDGHALIWDVPNCKMVLDLYNSGNVTTVEFSPYGKYALNAMESGKVNLWNLPDGTLHKAYYGHKARVNGASFIPNGKYFLSASSDSTIKLFDVESGLALKTYYGHQAAVNDVAVSPDGNYFVSVSDDGNVLMWEVISEELVGVFPGHSGPVLSVSYAPSGSYIVTGGSDGKAKRWDISTGAMLNEFQLHGSAVTDVMISPDSRTVVSASTNAFIYSWDAVSSSVRNAFVGNDQPVSSTYISKNSQYVITGTKDKDPELWYFKTGDEITPCYGHSKEINDVCFSPFMKFTEPEIVDVRPVQDIPTGELEEEIARLEEELASMEKQRALGYDPTLLDADINNSRELKVGDKIILERIYFDFDRYNIRDESIVELNKLLVFMDNYPKVKVEISGHTDARGSDEYNMKLSRNRAKSVVGWLKKKNVSSKRVVPMGYGETKHIAPNENPDGSDNPEGRQMNRRIELTIVDVGGGTVITTEGK
ncbi:MAG: WD40 repeat protein/outer membrane protein OmpA-like peptidoglycan-associated protein [Bacteroidia bacterium]|jgi:WD40 repeat protein/outer membrane protein OmpA-like peptidoglycan-associated protein